jgi:hypothetical protein
MSRNMREELGTRFLEPGDVARAWDAVRDISSECHSWERWERWTAPGPLLSGWWGGATLHLAYHHRIEPSAEAKKTIDDLLDLALSAAPRIVYPALYGGLAGVGWGLDHVTRLIGDEIDLDDLDDWLVTAIDRGAVRDHELIGGLAGLGFYGIERAHCEGGRRLVTAVIQKLESQARVTLDGVSWYKDVEFIPEWQRESTPNGSFNLGLSHGMPGAISLLADALRKNVCADLAAHLLDQSVPWLIKQYHHIGSRWHISANREFPPGERSRLAWCYNELGTTMPILTAADVMQRHDWRVFAEDVMHSLELISLKDSGIYESGTQHDPGLCHGIAGVAHLFAHAARLLDDDSLAATARGWMTTLLDARSRQHGVAGFPGFGIPDKVTNIRPITNDPGFLEGATGVGLVLLAALADEAPGWNRILGM